MNSGNCEIGKGPSLQSKAGTCHKKRGIYEILIEAFIRLVRRSIYEIGKWLLLNKRWGIYQKEKGHLLEKQGGTHMRGEKGHSSKMKRGTFHTTSSQ